MKKKRKETGMKRKEATRERHDGRGKKRKEKRRNRETKFSAKRRRFFEAAGENDHQLDVRFMHDEIAAHFRDGKSLYYWMVVHFTLSHHLPECRRRNIT
jgi:hypothetical protein